MYEQYHDIIRELYKTKNPEDSDEWMDILIKHNINIKFDFRDEPFYNIDDDQLVIGMYTNRDAFKQFRKLYTNIDIWFQTDNAILFKLIDLLRYFKQENIEKSILEMI